MEPHMRIVATAVLLPSVFVLAACPGPDRPEDVDVPPAAEQVQLEQMQGSGVAGEVAVTPRDNEVHVVVSVTGAPPEETLDVRLHAGTCQNPGLEVYDIGTIRTTQAGTGAIDATIGESPMMIMDGNHVAVIWAPVDGAWQDPATTDPAVQQQPGQTTPQDPAMQDPAMQQDPQVRDGGMMRDDRRAVACSALPTR